MAESKEEQKQNLAMLKSMDAFLKTGIVAAVKRGNGSAVEDALKNCRALAKSKQNILPVNPPKQGDSAVNVLMNWLRSAATQTDDPKAVGKSFVAAKKLYVKQMASGHKGGADHYASGMKDEREVLQGLLKSFSKGYSKQLKAAEKAEGEAQAKVLDKLAEIAKDYKGKLDEAHRTPDFFGLHRAMQAMALSMRDAEAGFVSEAKAVRKKAKKK